MINQQLDGKPDVVDALGFVDKDDRGVANHPLQVIEFMSGKQRLDIKIIAGKGQGVGDIREKHPHQRGFPRLARTVENQRRARLAGGAAQMVEQMLFDGALKHDALSIIE